MVHRIASALQLGTEHTQDVMKALESRDYAEMLNEQCGLCNEVRLKAKNASEECAVAFFCVWLKSREMLYPTLGMSTIVSKYTMLPPLQLKIFMLSLLPFLSRSHRAEHSR